MEKKKSRTHWYVYTRDAKTNATLAEHYPQMSEKAEKVECADGRKLNMWWVDHTTAAEIRRCKKQLNLDFDLYFQHGRSPAEKWRFREKKPKIEPINPF